MKNINTGTPRNVLGHVISGAIASAVISGAINYKKYQNGQIKKCEAIKDTTKKQLKVLLLQEVLLLQQTILVKETILEL